MSHLLILLQQGRQTIKGETDFAPCWAQGGFAAGTRGLQGQVGTGTQGRLSPASSDATRLCSVHRALAGHPPHCVQDLLVSQSWLGFIYVFFHELIITL